MTREEKEEFLQFLTTECDPEETLHQAAFRLTCFQYHKDTPPKSYFYCDQQFCEALWESNLVVPSLGIKVQYNEPIGKLVELLLHEGQSYKL